MTLHTAPKTETGRLLLLDGMRGIAAMLVVVFHWPHLWSIPGHRLDPAQIPLPLRHELGVIYQFGWMAVDLFFCISGFVFFWLYRDTLEQRKLGVGGFAERRFSRLYPLHLATLLAVGAMQVAMLRATGHGFIYPHTDWLHLGWQLLFMGGWGIAGGESFNGPSWSISVEILLYAVFVALCRVRLAGRLWAVLALVAMGVLGPRYDPAIGRGLVGFFMGGLVCRAWQARRDAPGLRAWAGAWVLLAAAGWAVTMAELHAPVLSSALHGLLARHSPHLATLWDARSGYLGMLFVTVFLFPATVLAAALAETAFPVRVRLLGWLGDCSYAAYLLHFPLQLALALLVVNGWLREAALGGVLPLLLFMAVLLAASRLSFAVIERPAQRWLRRRLGASRPALPATAIASAPPPAR